MSASTAAAVIEGDLSGLTVGAGWPHPFTPGGMQHALSGAYVWLVVLDGVVIGDCGTHRAADGGVIEIGYGLAESYRGRGYASEFVPAISAWLLAQPQIERVIAHTDAENLPSRRALERAGFMAAAMDGEMLEYVVERGG